MIDKPLNIRRKEWENLDEEGQTKMRNDIIEYFRNNGFPHFKYSLEEQKKEMDRLDKFVSNNEIEINGIIKQTMHGLGVCWSYHPHHWKIRCGNSKTPWEVFNDDELLDKSIKKRMKSGTHINEAMMRKTFKVSGGAQTVSNFRPSVARWVYDKYSGDGIVYDPCAGFGGRLLGAISSPRVKSYTGMDPSSKTMDGLERISKNLGKGTEINLYRRGSENFKPNGKFDLVFTSPPYYNTEKYSDEPTQSYIKFPTYEEWINGFLTPMIENSLSVLKDGGYFIINIANTKTAKGLENDFLEIMKSFNVKLQRAFKMSLSMQHSGGKFKYEPIFVYIKE